MSRTPLLAFLKRLATDHHLAEQSGLPLDVVREQREVARSRGITRRQFLGGAVVAAGALSLPRAARASGGGPTVAIVGGGMAGMAAALTLADAGFGSTVYEASGRIGGRMFSNNSGYWDNNQVTEWCGELIDTGHATVRRLARRFDLPLDDLLRAQPRGAEDTLHFLGGYYSKAQADADFAALRPALKQDLKAAGYPTTFDANTAAGLALDDMSIHQWIASRVPGGHGSALGRLLDVAYNIEFGAESSDQSSLNLLYLLAYQPAKSVLAVFGESDEKYHIRGGNQQLPVAIADHLGAGAVKTGWRMTSVRRRPDGRVELTFDVGASSRTVVADIAILTLPFAVLRHLDYRRADFDERKDLAIREQGAGRSGKLQLQFDKRVWNKSGPWGDSSSGGTFSDLGCQATWEPTRGQPGKTGVLNNFTGGSVTLAQRFDRAFGTSASADIRADAERFLGQIDPIYPGLAAHWNGKATHSLPHLDTNFRLAYAYYRVGQYEQFAGYEASPQGNILFAGEHTSIDFQGFMEGAASEGTRAGEEALALLRGDRS